MYAKNIWKNADVKKVKEIMDFNEGYKSYISLGKTERLCVNESVKIAEEAGYKDLSAFKSLKKGDKIYAVNKNKNIVLFVIGEKDITEGIRILGAHIDSPRLDVKQNPLYEKEEFAILDTHYYGGIKKYQWVTIPLAIHGVVCKKDGTTITINIGEDDNDPVLGITDLLVHLSADQMKKTASLVIEGENLDVTFGNIPLKDEEKDAAKANILKLLKEKYNIEEEDFISSELELVPAGKARDYGLDRSMVAGYGHDDRVCAYTSLKAVIDIENPEYTACCILVDKEEIGSVGATGASSLFFENVVAQLLSLTGKTSYLDLKTTMTNSNMLSSDVSAALDPLYLSVSDKNNNAKFSYGVVFNKYTGSRGKSGSNDAEPEYIAWIRRIMDENNIHYQTSELGKVDQGGGGTIAYILGEYNMNVIDAGVAVLNMHAPMEIVSKADVYEAYLAYKTFLVK
ncbi:aminopeptidase [Hujiaoplasma nucleasis]|uniref:M18 family aminopeptidase n=1 Tax=Hujiaoplasma nucleasis TaxID=2725268 RepID=A0A7L6N2S5_9MOLU|nr:aminopeptidase [Hujiaoplasma nucleasis]QLY40566.1 aminopeptidase [Hujiaoplasma nucleasis]